MSGNQLTTLPAPRHLTTSAPSPFPATRLLAAMYGRVPVQCTLYLPAGIKRHWISLCAGYSCEKRNSLRHSSGSPMTEATTERCSPLTACRQEGRAVVNAYPLFYSLLPSRAAAFFATARRFAGDIAAARAAPPSRPPRRPRATASASFPASGSISVVVLVVRSVIILASWFGSRGRFGRVIG